MPAVWSFALALRSRGLGSVWTTLHLAYEREVAELLGIPDNVTQVALLPVAYTIGQDFKPAARPPIERFASWNRYGDSAPPAERADHFARADQRAREVTGGTRSPSEPRAEMTK